MLPKHKIHTYSLVYFIINPLMRLNLRKGRLNGKPVMLKEREAVGIKPYLPQLLVDQ